MSDINFIASNEEEIKARDKQNDYQTEWTKPVPDKLKTGRNQPDPSSKEQKKDKTGDKKIKQDERIKKSRQEILAMLKKQKESQAKKEGDKKPKQPSKFFSWLKKAKEKKKNARPEAARKAPPQAVSQPLKMFMEEEFYEPVKEKKEIAAHQKALKEEKKERNKPIFNISAPVAPKPPAEAESIKKKILNAKPMTTPSKWEAPEIIKTNLVQADEEKVPVFDTKKNMRFLVLNVLVAVFIIAGVYGFVVYWEKDRIDNSASFAKMSEKQEQARKVQQQTSANLANFAEINLAIKAIDSHVYWSGLFELLEKYTLKDVYYIDKFAASLEKPIFLKANTYNYTNISNQLQALRSNEKVLDVQCARASADLKNKSAEPINKVSFELTIDVDPEIYKKQ